MSEDQEKRWLLNIRGRQFALTVREHGGPRPVMVLFCCDPEIPGEVVINATSPLYQQAKSSSNPDDMRRMLLFALAMEYSLGELIQPASLPEEPIDPFDLEAFIRERVMGPAYMLFAELLQRDDLLPGGSSEEDEDAEEEGLGKPVTSEAAAEECSVAMVDPQFLKENLQCLPFKRAVIEPVRNGETAGMTSMWWDTTDEEVLVIRDNGSGMTQTARAAFVGLGMSTRFGAGMARFAYPLCTELTVSTVSADEEDVVYWITLDMDQYFSMLLRREAFTWEICPKTAENWPYDHATGTVLAYKIRSNQRRLRRGRALAELLAAVLPSYLGRKQIVDGERIPSRLIVGKEYCYSVPKRGLLDVNFELYHPKQLREDDKLRLGWNLLGEVDFKVFYQMLPQELRDRIPEVFKDERCCGIIAWPAFSDFIVDQRNLFSDDLLQDERLSQFIGVLEEMANQVTEVLEIK